MAGASKHNGDQTKALVRELRALNPVPSPAGRASGDRGAVGEGARTQNRVDHAVALADREIGVPRVRAAAWAPVQPVPAPKPGSVNAGILHSAQNNSAAKSEFGATFGVSGTPITSGFLVDLGEYNAELMGRNAIPTYEKMRRSDAQVRATLMACKLPILSAKWEIVPADVAPGFSPAPADLKAAATASQAKEIAEFVKENLFGGLEFRGSSGGWVSQTWQSVIANALLMLDFGCAVHEDVWAVDGEKIRLRSLPSRLPVTFYRWHTEEDGETLLALEQYGYRGSQFLNVLLPADKICRFTYQQEGANFWGIALQRAMYPHWYIKSKLYRIDAIANERNALGIPVFRLSPGFSAEDKSAGYSFVTQLAAHEAAGLVEPPGDPHTGLRIVGYEGNLRDVMPSIQHHNEMISRAALNTFIDLGQAAHGSRALGATATDFFMLGLQSVADQIAQDITHSTIRRLVALNYGDEAPCPRLIAANVQARSIGEITSDLVALAQQGLIVSEKNIRQAIRERFALPEESDERVVAVRGETVTQGIQEVVGKNGKG